MAKSKSPKAEAAAWFSRLSQTSITNDAIREFFLWRSNAANRAAYRAIETEWERRRGRFVVLPDATGFSVMDSMTAEPATFANVELVGISEEDALDTMSVLNRRAIHGAEQARSR